MFLIMCPVCGVGNKGDFFVFLKLTLYWDKFVNLLFMRSF